MKQWLVLLSLLVVSCVSDPIGLNVKQYHLRENMFNQNGDLMARGEVQRLLHGAVTVEERREKIGQYYHVIWKQESAGMEGDEIVFEYQQASSGSKIKRLVHKTAAAKEMEAHFSIVGDDYRRNGRVLTWRATVRRDGRTIGSQKSYMWR
jgi:hypothetical protein